MKNLDDEAQMTDRERAFTDKQKIRQTAKCGDTSGKVMLTIPRLRATYFFKSMKELKEKRSRYELYEGEGTVK
jgi:hypothetical protein